MKVYKNGILIEVGCEIYIVPKTARGSVQFGACKKPVSFQKISSIDMNDLKFSIDGHWFHMEDFEFSNPG